MICLFTARAVDSEWTHLWPATSVNNHGRTNYLRLSHLAALSAGVNNYLRCIHKGLKAFSRVTPPIRMHDQTIFNTIFWSDVPDIIWCQRKLAPGRTKKMIWQHEKKKVTSWLFATDVPLLTHREKRIGFLFGSIRYRINISVFVINMTTRIWYIIFEPSFWQERAACF